MSDPTAAQIGRRIRRWRQHRDLTQTDLANKIGVIQGTVSQIELATWDLRLTTALAIATALDINLQTLITKDPS